MTDLPEALPILEHNTQATFGPPRDDDRHHVRDGDKAEKSCHGGMPLLPAGEVKRPAIRQLRWGDPADAEEVSAVAAAGAAVAAAATAAAGGKGPEGQGFDIIVVRERCERFINGVICEGEEYDIGESIASHTAKAAVL